MEPENTIINLFYKSIQVDTNNNDETEVLVDNYLDSLKILSDIIKENIYVIDFHQRCFRFVSDRGVFLSGRTSKEVLQLGYDFYPQIVHPEDLHLIAKIHQVIFHYFSHPNTPINDLSCVVFNFRIRGGREYLMVSHKVVPVIINNNVRLAFCAVSDSVLKTSGNLYSYFKEGKVYYRYSFKSGRWNRETKIILPSREKDILKWVKQGKTVKEIADILCLSDKTIRNQKVILFEKSGAKNVLQAVIFAENHFLI